MASEQIEITQIRSLIGCSPPQRRTVRALGLRRPNHMVTHPDRPEIRGMLSKVAHLVEVRYAGQTEAVGIEPGQEPKGQGRPPAGSSVEDEQAAALAEAKEEALSESGSASLGSLVQHPERLDTPEDPQRPKARKGADDEDEDEDELVDEIEPEFDTGDEDV